MAHYIGYELIQALAERPLDHQRDMRNILCPHPGCEEDEGHVWLCDKGHDRHAPNIVELPSGETRMVCDGCVEIVECSNGCQVPRWQTDVLEGDRFCVKCQSHEPGEGW